jgi:hypothetical protein
MLPLNGSYATLVLFFCSSKHLTSEMQCHYVFFFSSHKQPGTLFRERLLYIATYPSYTNIMVVVCWYQSSCRQARPASCLGLTTVLCCLIAYSSLMEGHFSCYFVLLSRKMPTQYKKITTLTASSSAVLNWWPYMLQNVYCEMENESPLPNTHFGTPLMSFITYMGCGLLATNWRSSIYV